MTTVMEMKWPSISRDDYARAREGSSVVLFATYSTNIDNQRRAGLRGRWRS
jgi:hypothetical protein